jgi:cytoskeleton protein RodZ
MVPAPTTQSALPPGAAAVPAPAASSSGDQTASATAAPAAPTEPAGPRVFGAVTGPSHITLLAKQDCWIQVRDSSDPSQALVAQRTLHAGDTYRVPDRGGLVLRTGNASGLEVLVDDKAIPALGGTVREVALDPARLLAGNALE